MGIDNYSGVVPKAVQLLLTTSFSNNISLFQLLQTMLVIFSFHSDFFIWKKIYIQGMRWRFGSVGAAC